MFGLKNLGRSNAATRTVVPSPAQEANQSRATGSSTTARGPLAELPKRKKTAFSGCMPTMPRVSLFGGKKSEKPVPEKDFRSQLEANLQVRLGLERAGMAKAHGAALAKAEDIANAGGTSKDLLHALDDTLAKQKRKTTAEERTHLKYAAFAQVASTHYTVASRFHGDEESKLGSSLISV